MYRVTIQQHAIYEYTYDVDAPDEVKARDKAMKLHSCAETQATKQQTGGVVAISKVEYFNEGDAK